MIEAAVAEDASAPPPGTSVYVCRRCLKPCRETDILRQAFNHLLQCSLKEVFSLHFEDLLIVNMKTCVVSVMSDTCCSVIGLNEQYNLLFKYLSYLEFFNIVQTHCCPSVLILITDHLVSVQGC